MTATSNSSSGSDGCISARNPPRITVVVPLHNGARYLAETLDSLSKQTLPMTEVIVVDDGSTDGGAELAREHTLRPILIRQPQQGAAVARNLGAIRATGTFVTFMDQDDLWLPTRHERLIDYLRTHPGDRALITKATEVVAREDLAALRRNGARWHEDRAIVLPAPDISTFTLPPHGSTPRAIAHYDMRSLLSGPPSLTTTFVVDRELYLMAGGCDPKAPSFDDYLAVISMQRLEAFVLIDEPSVLYRVHPDQTTFRTDWALPMALTFAWLKTAGGVAPGSSIEQRRRIARLVDERWSWIDKLFGMADQRTFSALVDALSVAWLGGADAADRRRAGAMILKRHAKARLDALRRLP